MGRKPRVEFAGAIFHVWARRVDRWPLFVDASDYERYLALLGQTVDRFGWRVVPFCLMPNHVHLLVTLSEPNLAAGMHSLHGPYVRHFNDRHNRVGRLFEDRFKWKRVDDELYRLTVIEYIEFNPVDAALSKSPDEWPWSSRGLLATGRAPAWLKHAAEATQPKDGARHRL